MYIYIYIYTYTHSYTRYDMHTHIPIHIPIARSKVGIAKDGKKKDAYIHYIIVRYLLHYCYQCSML